MKKRAILLTFEVSDESVLEAIEGALECHPVEVSISVEDYSDEYCGPVIYFP